MIIRRPVLLLVVSLLLLAVCACQTPPLLLPDDELQGAWKANVYQLKSGETHTVGGSIAFNDGRWMVIFYVLDEDGRPTRGSAEGGTYRVADERLSLIHLYNLSSGEARPGLEASPLRMELNGEGAGKPEECTYRLEAGRLTIQFPSGNSMRFTRFPR